MDEPRRRTLLAAVVQREVFRRRDGVDYRWVYPGGGGAPTAERVSTTELEELADADLIVLPAPPLPPGGLRYWERYWALTDKAQEG